MSESAVIRAIDMWAPIVPTREFVAHLVENFPDEMLGYVRVFWKQPPTQETVKERVPAFGTDLDNIVKGLDMASIERCFVTGFDEAKSCGKTFIPNEFVAKIIEQQPDRFIPFSGVDVMRGMDAVRELERWVNERGFRGLSLRPFMIGLPASDRRYYPLYAKCVELDIPVSLHTSANWTSVAVSDLGHPRHIDIVAADFPELKIIMSHAGYPWVLESVLLAWKYEHVYLELSAHRPRYFTTPGSGWESLMHYGQTTIQDKVLFGSGMFLLGRPPTQLLDEFRALPVAHDVMEKWLYGNAEHLLGQTSL